MGEFALEALELDRFSSDLDVTLLSDAGSVERNVLRDSKPQVWQVIRMNFVAGFVRKYAAVKDGKLFEAGLEVAELKPFEIFLAQS